MVYKNSPRDSSKETGTLRGGSTSPGKKRRARPWDQTDGDTRQNNRRLRREGQIAKEMLRTYKVGAKRLKSRAGRWRTVIRSPASSREARLGGRMEICSYLSAAHAGKLGGGQDVGAPTVASEPAGTE